MQYLVNATFLINSARSDFSFIEDIELSTLDSVLYEVELEIGMDVGIIIKFNKVHPKKKGSGINIPKNRLKQLSAVDKNLLYTAFEEKKGTLLVTDDGVIRRVAKDNRIRCLTTPKFIAYIVRHSHVDYNDALVFLSKLRHSYIRPKEVDDAIKQMKKWK